MERTTRKSYICLLIIICTVSLTAQNPYINDDHIGSEDGLASQLCQNIIEDDLGNIWISSFIEVQKYDGHNVKVFSFNEPNQKELTIHDLAKDVNGNIWVFEKHNTKGITRPKSVLKISNFKISIINPLTNKITSFYEYLNHPTLSKQKIIWIGLRKNKIIFITKDLKVYKYTDSITELYTMESLDNFIGIDADENLIIHKNGSIIVSNPLSQKTYKLPKLETRTCDAVTLSQDGQLYLSYLRGGKLLFKKNENGKLVDRIEVENEHLPFADPKHNTIIKDLDNHILINKKLFINNKDSNLRQLYNEIELATYDFIQTQSQLLYIATDLGVHIRNTKEKKIAQLASDTKMNSVRSIYISEDLRCYRTHNKEIITSPSGKYDLSFLTGNRYRNTPTSYYLDPKYPDILWSTGYVNSGTRRIDLKNKKIDYKFADYPLSSNLNTFHRSSFTDKLYLIGKTGILRRDSLTKKFIPFEKLDQSARHLSALSMNHLIEKAGKLWIASNSGVIVFDEQKNTFSIDTIFTTVIPDKIQYIHQDKVDNDILWLGTRRAGIKKWHLKDNTARTFDVSTGLSNNSIHAIKEDTHERLWISTNRYLNCLNKTDNKNFIFTEEDGLSNSEFNKNSHYYDTISNIIYFGGLNGYNYFNPDSIDTSIKNNNITVRLIDANKVKEDATIENIFVNTLKSKTIKLYEEDVSLDLDLSTNHLIHSKKTQFSYRILELSNEWKNSSSNNIKLTRLPYGMFTLELVADLNRTSQVSKVLTINIDVIKPFKKTWTYFFLSSFLMIAVTWYLVNLYLKSIKERKKKLEETVANRTKELTESNEKKNKLFAILAHDLRNPISSLTDITEKIKFLAKNNRLDEIDLLAEQTKGKISALNDNLNNILLWAMSENKLLKLNPEKLSLQLEIKKIIELYSTRILNKKLVFHFKLEIVDQVFLDINVLQTLLRNIISNAIKFSYKEGEISFHKTSETADRIVLSIQDNGIGMQRNVFTSKKKNKIRESGIGSGIGLKLSRELATLSDVHLSFLSNDTGGTTVLLDMPKRQLSLSENDV